MTSSLDMIRGRSNVVTLTNSSGGALVAGDVCILNTGADESATTTTSANSVSKVYIAAESIAGGATGKFYSSGFCPLVTPSASVTRGRYLFTHTVAKQAAENATYGAGAFGVILKSGTTPSVWLFGSTAQGSGGGAVATDTIWDAAGDLVQGTGADTAARLALGTANQVLRVNSGATAVEWASVGRVLISEQTPTATGTVTWSSIAATYTSLVIEFIARTNKASATASGMYLYFNNDTTAGNYRRESLTQGGTGVTGGVADNSDALTAAAVDALANNATYATVQIFFYAKTVFHKYAMIRSASRAAASTSGQNIQTVYWENTAAIDRIDIVTDDSSNYIAGTTFRLYGVY